GALGGAGERRDHEARIDRVVVRHVEREADRRREGGLDPAGLGRAQPLGPQAEERAQRELAVERLRLVAVARDEQRPPGPVVDVDAARLAQLLGERGPRPRALEAEAQERLLAGVRLADRREHPGGDVRRAVAELAAVEHADAQAARRRAPRGGEADQANADDGYAERLRLSRDRLSPRFAGMTRISS